MLDLCRQAQAAGLKLSVTAILGLGGRARSREHARATAAWVNRLSPAYFSLLTLIPTPALLALPGFVPLTRGEVLEEILALVQQLQPQRTLLRSNHASNLLSLAGTLPKDGPRLVAEAERALALARQRPDWFAAVTIDGERAL